MLSVAHLADPGNADFVARLVPHIDPGTIVGARVPALRAYAKESWRERPGEVAEFLQTLPHRLFDENMLHGLLLSQSKDPQQFLDGAEAFLPYIDNWAVCDSMSAKPCRRWRPPPGGGSRPSTCTPVASVSVSSWSSSWVRPFAPSSWSWWHQ